MSVTYTHAEALSYVATVLAMRSDVAAKEAATPVGNVDAAIVAIECNAAAADALGCGEAYRQTLQEIGAAKRIARLAAIVAASSPEVRA